MIFGTISFRGCGGQPLALLWNIRVKSQMPIAPEHAFKEKSTKLLILLPLRTIYNCTFQCETPCSKQSVKNGSVNREIVIYMEAESHNRCNFLNLWKTELALWDEPNVDLKCQSVHRDMMFLASNSLHNLRGQKWSCPCYHARHLQQIHWSKLLCGMYGFTAKSSVPTFDYHVSY